MTAPFNDNIARAVQLDVSQFSTNGYVIDDATTETGEPGGISQTAWFWFYAYNNASGVLLRAFGPAGDAPSGDGITPAPYGALDTVMNVYTATSRFPSMGSLTLVASNDNTPLGGGRKWSQVTISVTAGLYYFIQVGPKVPGYKGQASITYTGLPNSLPAPLAGTFSTFIGCATTTEYVDCKPGFPIPVQMPSGVQAGDQLVAFIVNGAVNPVDINGPSGWTGTLSTGFFTKTADGSEDGAVINWTTQDTTEVFNNSFTRPIVAFVSCYRFVVPPLSEFRFFGGGSASAASVLVRDIPPGRVAPTGSDGLVSSTHLRVEFVFGIGGVSSDLTSGNPLTDATWTNPTPRCGLVGLTWSGGHIQNDSVGGSLADVEYNFPPPFSVYNPHDSVLAVGGAEILATVYTAQYNFPGYAESLAYWGINASTPT